MDKRIAWIETQIKKQQYKFDDVSWIVQKHLDLYYKL